VEDGSSVAPQISEVPERRSVIDPAPCSVPEMRPDVAENGVIVVPVSGSDLQGSSDLMLSSSQVEEMQLTITGDEASACGHRQSPVASPGNTADAHENALVAQNGTSERSPECLDRGLDE